MSLGSVCRLWYNQSFYSCITYLLGEASMAMLSPGSHHTCHHVGWWSLSVFSATISSLYSQLNRLQLSLNSSAQAVSKSPKFYHITPLLQSLHWHKIQQSFECKALSITYKTLQSGQPSYLHSLFKVQSNHNGYHLTVNFTLSFILTSFIYATSVN